VAYSLALKVEAKYLSKTSVDVMRLHGIIFQKIELFVTITVRASYPTHPFTISFSQ
jgi:hypothetical protein